MISLEGRTDRGYRKDMIVPGLGKVDGAEVEPGTSLVYRWYVVWRGSRAAVSPSSDGTTARRSFCAPSGQSSPVSQPVTS